jgi:hypothetical protein
MSWVSLKRRDHNAIRTSESMKRALKKEASRLANLANSRAGITDGYVTESPVNPNPDLTVSQGRARAHVWAKTSEAIRAERKDAILMGIAGDDGAG